MTISPDKEWWTADEIAARGLPDLPKTRQGVEALLKKLGWRAQPSLARRRAGRGGGWEYSDPRPLFGPSGMLASQIGMLAGPSSVEVGSSMVYAAVMHFGAGQGAFGADRLGHPIPWGNIPPRPFLGIADEDRAGLVEILEEWLMRAAGGQP